MAIEFKKQKQGARTMDLAKDPVGKLLLQLAIPAICAQVVNMLYNMIDRMYIGHIAKVGGAALTGVGVTFPVIILISAFAVLIGMGGAPRASICLGAGDRERAEQILGNCCTALIAISVVLTFLFLRYQAPLLKAFGASADTLPYALDYLNVYVLGTVFVQFSLGLNTFLSAQGCANLSMMTVIIGALLNLILDPIFIFGFHMGVQGAALATVLSQGVSAIWVGLALFNKNRTLRLHIKNLKIQANIILPVLALGSSPFVMQSTESLLSVAFNVSMQKYGGDIAVGTMTILNSVLQMISLPLSGLTAGAQPIIGYNYGACKPERMKKTVHLLVKSALCFTGVFWIIIQVFPKVFVMFFTKDPVLLEYSAWAMRVFFGTVFIVAIQNTLQQSFIALGETKVSLGLALLRKIILLIPAIFIFPYFLEDKVLGVLLAEPVSDFIAAMFVVVLFRKRFRALLVTMNATKKAKL